MTDSIIEELYRRTAYHEAGHAVAAVLLGEYLYRVRISREPVAFIDRKGHPTGPDRLGSTEASISLPYPGEVELRLKHFPEHEKLLRVGAINNVFYALGGYIAQAKAAGVTLDDASDDFFYYDCGGSDLEAAHHVLAPFEPNPRKRDYLLMKLWEPAARKLYEAKSWKAVEVTARALLDGVTDGEELMKVIEADAPVAPPRNLMWEEPIIEPEDGFWGGWKIVSAPPPPSSCSPRPYSLAAA